MRRVPVDSTSVASIGYSVRKRELEIEFRPTGDVYRYFGVSPEEYAEFFAAKSMGTYLNQVFKHKDHPFKKTFGR
jgi:hypothetical protein